MTHKGSIQRATEDYEEIHWDLVTMPLPHTQQLQLLLPPEGGAVTCHLLIICQSPAQHLQALGQEKVLTCFNRLLLLEESA